MHFCEGMDDSPVMIRLQAKHGRRTLEMLPEIHKGHDLELRVQAALWVTAGSFIVSLKNLTPQYIRKTCEAIDTAGLRFIPTYGRPPEFSEDLQEKLSLLSQAVYFENLAFLACGGAEPTMTTRIEEEFRNQLQVRRSSPRCRLHVCSMCPDRQSIRCCSKYVR